METALMGGGFLVLLGLVILFAIRWAKRDVQADIAEGVAKTSSEGNRIDEEVADLSDADVDDQLFNRD